MKPARAAHLALGRRGEAAACRLLEAKGVDILARNWRVKAGELDIVARDGAGVVFVEVKTLHRKGFFRPLDNLSAHQKKRNFQAAQLYLRMIGGTGLPVRFDLVEVVASRWRLREIRHHHDYLPRLNWKEMPG
ncbi:YraN family protein [Victivallis vadensis]|uniref:YraN family protein n=1 Tax=Victivallis vadensis TaxID=172901 RepID=UPI00266C4E02|nr:YraN family protein [Victivallis vadensis]